MKSIRAYLLSRLLGGSIVILVAAGFAVYFAVARSHARRFDENLADRVLGFASILFQTKDGLEFEFSGELMPEYERANAPAYFELRVVGGAVVESSESLAGRELSVVGTPGPEPIYWTAPLPDGRTGRFVAQIVEVHHVFPEEGPDRPTAATVLVTIARGREDLVVAEQETMAWCALVCVALCSLIAFVTWTAVHGGLEPANRLAAALDALDVERLPDRLEVGEVPKELAPVAEKSAALIRRVDAALKRERRTTADIAHELRTPISELVTVTEVALRNGSDPEGSRRALSTARNVAWRMGHTVSTLLRLARLQTQSERFERVEVELADLVAEALRSGNGVAHAPRVDDRVAAGDRMQGDRDVLRIVISNLISNALHYTPSDGFVRCRVERDEHGTAFVVENGPVDLAPEDLASLAEPFWRKDGARADRARSGLGLALSHALAEHAEMRLAFTLEGSTFRAMLADREPTRAT
ncbi:MAG: hypothetical protein K8S98_08995 [Planctomycetes bacterium]|nr:hypothetical protein [Planctomycetota bacterium]